MKIQMSALRLPLAFLALMVGALPAQATVAVGSACTPDNSIGVVSGTSGQTQLLNCVSSVWALGPVALGTSTATCASGLYGTIRWTGTAFEGCSSAGWGALATGGGGSSETELTAITFTDGPSGVGTATSAQMRDGDSLTYLGGTGGTNFVTADLGSSASITRIQLMPAQAYTGWSNLNGSTIQTSNDNSTWTTISTVSGFSSYAYLYFTIGQTARYVRIMRSDGTLISAGEFRVYGVPGSGGGSGSNTTALGTAVGSPSPYVAADVTSGLYSAGAGKVDVAISGTKLVEWTSAGEAISGTLTTSGAATIGASGTSGTLNFPNTTSGFTNSLATLYGNNQFTITGASNVIKMTQNDITVGNVSDNILVSQGSHYIALTTAGGVGIGTTTAYSKLDVTAPNNQIHFSSTAVDSGGYLLSLSDSQALMWAGGNFNGTNWIAKATTSSGLQFNSGYTYFYGNTGLTVGSTFSPINRLTIDPTGNIGIGTSAPFTRLEVRNDLPSGGAFPATTGSTDTSVIQRFRNSNVAFDLGGQLAGPIWLQNRSVSDFSVNYALLLNPNGGNVGIGTTIAYSKLDVTGANPQVHFSSTAVDSGGYLISAGASSAVLWGGASSNGSSWTAKSTAASGMGVNNGNIQFYTDTGLTAGSTYTPSTRVTIDTSGNIGIGTTSPSARLQVVSTNASNANLGGFRVDDRGDGCCSQITQQSGTARWDTYVYGAGGWGLYQVNHGNGTAGLGQVFSVNDIGNASFTKGVYMSNNQQFFQYGDDGTAYGVMVTGTDGSMNIRGYHGTNMMIGVNGATYIYGSGTSQSGSVSVSPDSHVYINSAVTSSPSLAVYNTAASSGNIAVYASSSNNVALYGQAVNNYGVYATATNNHAMLGSASKAAYAGVYANNAEDGGTAIYSLMAYSTWGIYSNGGAFFSGQVYSNGSAISSDIRLKDHIETFHNGLDTLRKIRGVTFDWKKDGTPSMGIIAQEVKEVLPALVSKAPGQDFYSVNYSGFVAPIIEAIKELADKFDGLNSRVGTLEQKLQDMGDENARLKLENAQLQRGLDALSARVGKIESKQTH